MTTQLPLIVAQYQVIGHHPLGPSKHWSLVALASRMHAHVFELHGNPSSYGFVARFEDKFSKAPHLRGGYQVGFIRIDQLAWLQEKLRELPIIMDDMDRFNSQIWVINALQLLKEEGVISVDIGYGSVREELEKEQQRWEVADDTLEERLFP